VNKKLIIKYTPNNQHHAGHEINSIGIVHGGISLFLIDSCAGAFAYAFGESDTVPTTQTLENKFIKPIISDIEVTIEATLAKTEDRDFYINIETKQDGRKKISTNIKIRCIPIKVATRLFAAKSS
jgi:acyl-coenzyme A thioesterase PaaI-like protein